MEKNKLSSTSLIFKLLISTISTFVIMMILSSYLIGSKQTQLAHKMEQELILGVEESKEYNQLVLIIDETQIRTQAEFRFYTVLIMTVSVLIGGAMMTYVVVRILLPLKELTAKINRININNVTKIQHDIDFDQGSIELRKLSRSFQNALNKIYENYEKQKLFSVNVAHELRTPLAVLQTKVDVFKKKNKEADPEVLKFANALEKNILRLSKLVDDILFISRNDAPREKMILIRELCEEICFDLEEKAEKKNIALSVEGESGRISTDDILLERTIFNLVDNAIKYTPEGGVCRVQIEEDAQTVRINVIDNGPGIPVDQKESVFDLFYRVDASRSRETGGYGVGLSLVKNAVYRVGGTVMIEDNIPCGSIFRITLPKKRTSN